MSTIKEDFENCAKHHLGQGYPLTVEDHTYMHPVTRWAFHAYRAAAAAQQAIIDRLMLEHCPSEMSAEQLVNWESAQKRAELY